MKKSFIAVAALLFITGASQAQTQTERENKVEKHQKGKKGMYSHRGGMQHLNVNDDQKKQFKELNEGYRKQFTELRNNKSLSADEIKSRSSALRKEQHEKMQSLLTTDQKAQMAAHRKDGTTGMDRKAGRERKEGMQERGKGFDRNGKGFDRMKDLGLTEAQSEKLKNSQAGFRDKMKAVRADKNLTEAQKKEQVKELAKQNKENMKSVLTPEQLEKKKSDRKTRSGSIK